jgi:glycosyltransferase involved in cell wall biosynthesis
MTALESPIPPLVSIVLPVKNGAQYIGDAIDSLLAQTFSDFELIVIDDGSTDQTAQIVKSYTDSRVSLVSQENQGVAKAANRGFALAKGKYITRHDHDDISLPARIEKQIQFLEGHPECGMVGSWAKIWVGNDPTERVHRHPTQPSEIAFALLFNAPFVNASCLFRREVLEWSGGYTEDEQRIPPEDYEFFSRIGSKFELANIPEYLMIYREVPNSESSVIRSDQLLTKERYVSHLALLSAENLTRTIEDLDFTFSPGKDANNFGCLVHTYFQGIKKPLDLPILINMLHKAAGVISIRFHDSEVMKLLNHHQLFLEYQYHTYMGNKYHWSRLKYLFFNRHFLENFGSIGRLLKRILASVNAS